MNQTKQKTVISFLLVSTLCLLLSGAAQADDNAKPGWQIWDQNCDRCHGGLQMPAMPDDPAQMTTVLRHMRGIANFPNDWVPAVKAFLTGEDEE